ncbi:hypothetical protein HK097_010801 [Rhizophlyctis rosea]|uniref:TLDc domain-containing protein n=1 Tax=Rhizophlyctis rosea TaxID=64517 RepID=A0AAD5S750_9FUNG|nr:hypothetical protein HK097_010801 [Rhizophlyctis rosea]
MKQSYIGTSPYLSGHLFTAMCANSPTPNTLTHQSLTESLSFLCHNEKPTLPFLERLFTHFDTSHTGLSASDLTTLLQDLLQLTKKDLSILTPSLPKEDPTPYARNLCLQACRHIHALKSQSHVLLTTPPDSSLPDRLAPADLADWALRNIPNLFLPVQTLLSRRFLEPDVVSADTGAEAESTSPEAVSPLPVIHGETSILTDSLATLLSWSLPVWRPADPKMETGKQLKWEMLYSAERDGFSINRFEQNTLKYPGPTFLLIMGSTSGTSPQQIIVGAYLSSPWKKSRQFWGDQSFQILHLLPNFEVYPPSGQSDNVAYLSGEKSVVGFGGEVGKFWLSTDLRTGTYKNDPLASKPAYQPSATRGEFEITFDVDNVEVFGLGGEQALASQKRAWKFEAQDASRRAEINLAGGKEVAQQLLAMAVESYSVPPPNDRRNDE